MEMYHQVQRIPGSQHRGGGANSLSSLHKGGGASSLSSLHKGGGANSLSSLVPSIDGVWLGNETNSVLT